MIPDIEPTHGSIASESAAQAWITPEITSFDVVTVTEGTGVLAGDLLNSLS
jgi:hypothetical protein